MALLELGSTRAREEGEGEGKIDTAPGEEIRTGARAQQARFTDVRRVASPVLLPSARAYGVESTVNELNSFEMILIKV